MYSEWDEEKRANNINKHGIDIISVIPVLHHPNVVEQHDEINSMHEERYQIIGMAEPGVLFVAYTERDDGDTIRIISGHHAGENE